MARLYFDPDRSRLVRDDGWCDMSEYNDAELLAEWCASEGIEFFDHRIDKYPEWLRRPLLRARAVSARGYRKRGVFFNPFFCRAHTSPS